MLLAGTVLRPPEQVRRAFILTLVSTTSRNTMTRFYWCLTHERVEEGATCRALDRLGPYPSAEAARGWRDTVEDRDETWQAEDERWHGTDDEDEDEDEPG